MSSSDPEVVELLQQLIQLVTQHLGPAYQGSTESPVQERPRDAALPNLQINHDTGLAGQIMSPDAAAFNRDDIRPNSQEGIRDARQWQAFRDDLIREDREEMKKRKDELNNMLIYAGLFSAVLTAFIIDTYRDGQEDPSHTTVFLLSQISHQLNSFSSNGQFTNSTVQSSFDAPINPGDQAVLVNALWFVSLVLSLLSALLDTLAQQWVHEYLRIPFTRTSDSIIYHQAKHIGLDRWKFSWLVPAVTLLIQVSVVLFLIGLLDLMWHFDHTLAVILIVVVGLSLSFGAVITITPIFSTTSPYTSTLTEVLRSSLLSFYTFIHVVSDVATLVSSPIFRLRPDQISVLRRDFRFNLRYAYTAFIWAHPGAQRDRDRLLCREQHDVPNTVLLWIRNCSAHPALREHYEALWREDVKERRYRLQAAGNAAKAFGIRLRNLRAYIRWGTFRISTGKSGPFPDHVFKKLKRPEDPKAILQELMDCYDQKYQRIWHDFDAADILRTIAFIFHGNRVYEEVDRAQNAAHRPGTEVNNTETNSMWSGLWRFLVSCISDFAEKKGCVSKAQTPVLLWLAYNLLSQSRERTNVVPDLTDVRKNLKWAWVLASQKENAEDTTKRVQVVKAAALAFRTISSLPSVTELGTKNENRLRDLITNLDTYKFCAQQRGKEEDVLYRCLADLKQSYSDIISEPAQGLEDSFHNRAPYPYWQEAMGAISTRLRHMNPGAANSVISSLDEDGETSGEDGN